MLRLHSVEIRHLREIRGGDKGTGYLSPRIAAIGNELRIGCLPRASRQLRVQMRRHNPYCSNSRYSPANATCGWIQTLIGETAAQTPDGVGPEADARIPR